MRTTLTLDEDVARLVDMAVHRDHRSMKQVVNDALRRALAGSIAREVPYRLIAHESGVRPGIDPAGFNRFVDESEDDVIVDRSRRGS